MLCAGIRGGAGGWGSREAEQQVRMLAERPAEAAACMQSRSGEGGKNLSPGCWHEGGIGAAGSSALPRAARGERIGARVCTALLHAAPSRDQNFAWKLWGRPTKAMGITEHRCLPHPSSSFSHPHPMPRGRPVAPCPPALRGPSSLPAS